MPFEPVSTITFRTRASMSAGAGTAPWATPRATRMQDSERRLRIGYASKNLPALHAKTHRHGRAFEDLDVLRAPESRECRGHQFSVWGQEGHPTLPADQVGPLQAKVVFI